MASDKESIELKRRPGFALFHAPEGTKFVPIEVEDIQWMIFTQSLGMDK